MTPGARARRKRIPTAAEKRAAMALQAPPNFKPPKPQRPTPQRDLFIRPIERK